MTEKIVFYDIDTQRDFMFKRGRLYVPNAETIILNLKILTKFAQKNKLQRIATKDTHTLESKEFKRNGGPFPDHCLLGTFGWGKICPTDILSVEEIELLGLANKSMTLKEFKANASKLNITLFKNTIDMFSNPFAKHFAKATNIAIVYGVATEYCVKAAVLGLLKNNVELVIVIKDAIKAITPKGKKEAIEEMSKAGAVFMTTKQVIKVINSKLEARGL